MSYVKHIQIQNFTAFQDMELSATSGINVVIGENGTGKTHLLKLLYAGSEVVHGKEALLACFCLADFSDSLLHDRKQAECRIQICTENTDPERSILHDIDEKTTYQIASSIDVSPAIYIPAKDMLTHAKGLLSMAEKYQDFPFDKTLMDIIRKANQWKLREIPPLAANILPHLERLMDGQVVIENEEFFIKKTDGRMVNFATEAEGLKKVGLLWQLLMNESIEEGSLLLWDELETSMNPVFLPVIVECLLELSRHGVQVFVSTHNYLLAKYFDVRRQENDMVCFHSLYKDEAGAVSCETKEHFDEVQHNAIMEMFDNLMDEVYGLQAGE